MWTSRPSLFQRISSLAAKPTATMRNWKVEPVRLEPEEQVDAEDHRKGAEAERVGLPPRPAKQHVEGVGEEQLRGDERGGVVDRPPVPAPVEQHRTLRARLEVVLLPQDDLQRERAARRAGRERRAARST